MRSSRHTAFWILACFALSLAVSPPASAGSIDLDSLLDLSSFVDEVDNPFFPLKPGTTFFYQGTSDGSPITNEFAVTFDTKQILGVTTTVVHDRSFEDGQLAEDTFDWFAQDAAGHVWYFGEDTTTLDPDTGQPVSTVGSWEAGVNGAQPGIIMEAHPHVGDLYQQEVALGVAQDSARVLSLDQFACVSFGCFDHLLLTEEQTPLHPGELEWKYYAKDVGFILGNLVQGGNEHTELVSVDVVPEPSSFMLLAFGLLCFAVRRRPGAIPIFTFSRKVLVIA